MGIINCTPDSFYKDSRQLKIKDIIKTAEQMIIDGADILDIGGASTRPGSKLPSVKEEKQRVPWALFRSYYRLGCASGCGFGCGFGCTSGCAAGCPAGCAAEATGNPVDPCTPSCRA